jgi:predicted transcriptional regulator of viral defense system
VVHFDECSGIGSRRCEMNWTTILTEEARKNCMLRTDELASKWQLSVPIVRNALRRYELRGLVERVSTKIYINHLNQQFSPRDLVNILRPESYISLESALVEKGVISQSPSVLTCVTPGYPQSFRSKSVNIVYRKISAELYWGTEERSTRYNKYRIAEPEKALLDWIYLSRQEGLPTPLDELQLQFIDAAKLRDYAERFPRTVREIIKEILVNRSLRPQSARLYHPEER